MDNCPNCCQRYRLGLSHPKINNLPLFLSCGHSMCEKCIGNIVKFGEPIECKVCHRDMAVDPDNVPLLTQNKIKLYQLFPVNIYMLGELCLRSMEDKSEKKSKTSENDCFIDLVALLKSIDNSQGECLECHGATTKMCQQCATNLCEHCFNKIHKNFAIFKSHVLKNIGRINEPNDCKMHKGKPLDYYCKDCAKPVCMDCMMVGGATSCKNHNITSMQEVNEGCMEELSNIFPKVDETFRRLTKTAVDIGQLLYNIENETDSSCESTKTIATIEQHFSKLDSQLQKHKQELISACEKHKLSEKESLIKAKEEVSEAIKKAKTTLDMINSSTDATVLKESNLSALLENAKKVVDTPWCLKKDETQDALKVVVNEAVVEVAGGYICLQEKGKPAYKLYSTSDLGEDAEIPSAPPLPVYPPELPKDVRQTTKAKPESATSEKQSKQLPPYVGFYKNAPQYRSKSESVSSLNSDRSANSLSSCKSSLQSVGNGNQKPVIHTVTPFAESQHPKQLHEGAQEVVYITHIVDPHNFFVQRACHQRMVKELLREFRNAQSLPKPSLSHIAQGKVYLVHNRADNMWHRGRVISIDRKNINTPILHVFCFDFGSTETVTIDKLRLIPPPRLSSPLPLAINCCLANCEPKAGGWSSDDSFLIRNIIDNKQAVIHVRHIRATTDYTLKFDCDVTTFEDGISLAHALVFHERARMPNPKLPYPKILGANNKPKIFTSTHDLKPKTVEEVYITHIVSPDKFFVRKRHLQSVFDKLSEDLEFEYSVHDDTGTIYLPEIGMVCAVNLSKAQTAGGVAGDVVAGGGVAWARGVVSELPGRGRVRVSLPDTGELLLVHWTAIRRIDHKFTTLGALAVECHLAGVTPLNKKWSTGSVALLQRFEGRLLEMQVEDNRGRGSLGITLVDKADDENHVCINTLMIKHKFAVSFGLFGFNKDTIVETQVTNNLPPEPKPSTSQQKCGKTTIQKKTAPTKVKEEDLDAKDKGPLRLEAKIVNYQSPSLIYISLIHQQKTFNELFDKMQKYYSTKKTPTKKQWKVGDRCCILYNQTQTWRRAVIMDIQNNKAQIFLSDFACVETVPISSLLELTAEFASIGDAALKCHLCGVVPVGDEWPSLTKEYLKELLDAYKRVFITKVGNFKDKSMPIEIWVYHTIQGGALEPNKSEWRCLNEKIIEQGLGIPDKSQEGTTTGSTVKPDDEILSFLNITGSVADWVRLDPLPSKPIPKPESDGNTTPSSPDDVGEPEMGSDADNTVFVTDWLPPEPLSSFEFTGVPTYVDNDGAIYLHEITQQDTLDVIRKALDVRFDHSDPKTKRSKWRVGEPCIALYYLDNRFHRGRVLEVNEEASTCLIQYVDYGNEETCSFENLRKGVVLYQIPIQAHKCVLNRIRPVDGQWTRQTLDYIHKSVVEKHCFVKVTGDQVGDMIPIDLKFDKLWLNDHLVEFEMAVYTDGSKPVVRKFVPTTSQHQEEELFVGSESDPDFIVEDDVTPTPMSSTTSNDSFNMESMEGKDWNKLVEEEDRSSPDGKFITFPKDTKKEFICNILVIQDLNQLELNVVHDDDTAAVYEELYAAIQKEAENMNPLNGVYENKACVALFPEDEQWYRASILQHSASKNLIKVKYVDYGNIAVIPLENVREINEAWTKLPPATITAKLWEIKPNEEIDVQSIAKQYADTFLDKGPFHVKVIDYEDSIPLVELRNDKGDLIYENLVESGTLLKK